MENTARNYLLSCNPDVETASSNYEKRFAGKVGQYFLEHQAEVVLDFLPKERRLKILEVGGGHCQLTKYFLEQGHDVWVQGSDQKALWKIAQLQNQFPNNIHEVISPFSRLDFENQSFDVVIAIRLMSHIDDWKKLVSEMCRLAKEKVIIDFPPKSSFNVFYPLFFKLKRFIEKDTRPYISFTKCEIRSEFKSNDFSKIEYHGQFFVPMVMHRFIKKPRLSKLIEIISKRLFLTKLFGSPMIFAAQKIPEQSSK